MRAIHRTCDLVYSLLDQQSFVRTKYLRSLVISTNSRANKKIYRIQCHIVIIVEEHDDCHKTYGSCRHFRIQQCKDN